MSFILEALKKSERERQAALPGAPAAVPLRRAKVPEPRRFPSGRLMAMAGAGVAVLALAFAAWLYLDSSSDHETVEVTTKTGDPAAASPVASVERQAPARQNPISTETPARSATAAAQDDPGRAESQKAVASRANGTPAEAGEGTVRQTAGVPGRSAVVAGAGSSDDARQMPAPQPTEPESATSPVMATDGGKGSEMPEAVRTEPPVVEEAPAPESAPPSRQVMEEPVVTESESAAPAPPVLDLRAAALDDAAERRPLPRRFGRLPYDVQTAISPLDLQVHVYDEDPRRCFVMINGATYAVGGEIKPGLRLEDIVPEGVVMDWKGERFLLTPRD